MAVSDGSSGEEPLLLQMRFRDIAFGSLAVGVATTTDILEAKKGFDRPKCFAGVLLLPCDRKGLALEGQKREKLRFAHFWFRFCLR